MRIARCATGLLLPALIFAGFAAVPAAAQDTMRLRTSKVTRAVQVPRFRPSVLGLTYAEAEARLRRVGLSAVTRDSVVSGGSPDVVLQQIPAAGAAIRGPGVDTLILARLKAQRVVDVPGVLGKRYGEALDRIRGAGLEPVGPPLASEDKPRARVIRQSPAAGGQANLGSAVRLEVVIDNRVRVPSILGKDTATARRLLADSQLDLGRMTLDESSQSAGTVIDQRPGFGDSVEAKTEVAIRVSSGPHVESRLGPVPDLLGATLNQARSALSDAGLVVGQVETTTVQNGRGLVVHQKPHAGELVHPRDRVHIVVGVAQAMATAPRLLGLTETRASDELRRAGLALGSTSFSVDSLVADGTVIFQSVAEGTQVPTGTPVDLKLARQPEWVLVPSVIHLTQPRAEDSLRRSRLSVGTVTLIPDTASQLVVRQMPPHGARVLPGAVVALVVSHDTTAPPQIPVTKTTAAPGPVIDTGTPAERRVVTATRPPLPRSPQRPAKVLMPAVVDSTLSWAEPHLTAIGFRNVVVSHEPPAGPVYAWVVTTQAPQSGEMLLPVSLIRLSARAVPAREVPSVIGLSETAARIEAESERLKLVVREREQSLRFLGTRVTAQSPRPDSLVLPGSELTVDISDPLSPTGLAGTSLLGLAGLGMAVRSLRRRQRIREREAVRPADIRVELKHGESVLTITAADLVRPPEVRLVARLEVGRSEIISARSSLIDPENGHHG